MASMEPPRYNESFQEFEMPSYASSFQQLQNLPPPLTDEPSLMDSSIQPMSPYEMQPTSSIILMDNSEPIPPPYGENTLDLSHPQQFHPTKFEPPMEQLSQSFGDYSNTGVDDKIKDILARYNPHAPNTNVPKQEPTIDSYRGNQTFEASLPSHPNIRSPPMTQQVTRPSVPQVTEIQKPVQYQTPLQSKPNQYPTPTYPPQPIQPVSAPPPQQPQIRARVVQNLPSNPTTQSPSPQRYQQQTNLTPGSPQVHQGTVHQPPVPHQHPPQVYQPPPQNSPVLAPSPQPTMVPQPAQADASYLQLVQQQAIQFSLQNQQIQNLQNLQNQQSKELLDKMQSYFDKINTFMERSEKRLTSLEQTAQNILKKGPNNNDDVSSFLPKGELELLKKMQDQMESDFDIAKRLQAEMDSKYNKEKKEEKRKEKKEKKSSSSSTSSSKSPSSSSMQECPICTLKVPFSDLELHVNQCLESIEKGNGDTKDTTTQEKASFWRRVFGPGPKKNADDKDSSKSTPSPSRPALPAPPTSSTASVSTPSPTMYPSGQDFYQMPFVYRGGYPQPQMVTPQGYYPYPGQQIYYIPPPGMPQQPTQGKK